MNKYLLIYTNGLGLFDDNIIIEGDNPKQTLEKYLNKKLKICKARKADYILWTGNKRIGFI